MKYRKFGQLNWQVSALGFGAMRLPIVNSDSAQIDVAQAIIMIRWAIDHGLNYVDTAYPYHQGQSEIVVGKTLQGGYRQKVKLATKLPLWAVENDKDCDRILDEQLARLQTKKIDFYLLHGLDREKWLKVERLKILQWARKAQADGRLGHLGFSFHDNFDVFKKIVDACDWAFCQIQYNLLDINFQAGQKGLHYAAKKGLAVVIMEPLRGGELAQPPVAVQKVWNQMKSKRKPVDWALQWLWDQPEVTVVLSGMSSLEQVKQNVASAGRSGVNSLKAEQREIIAHVRKKYQQLQSVPCTGCQYCLPCPQGVNIPRVFKIYNTAQNSALASKACEDYQNLDPTQRANSCVQCHACEKACPQSIKITDHLKHAHKFLSSPPRD